MCRKDRAELHRYVRLTTLLNLAFSRYGTDSILLYSNATVDLLPENVGKLPEVLNNGFDFSDGVGTISDELLHRVWQVSGRRRYLKPTILQIRFQGSKGVVSLDSRLDGQRLMLRSNM